MAKYAHLKIDKIFLAHELAYTSSQPSSTVVKSKKLCKANFLLFID